MALTRKALANLGLTKDIIENVMALHGVSIAKYISKSYSQTSSLNAVREIRRDSLGSDFRKNNGNTLNCRKINQKDKRGACRYAKKVFISGAHLNLRKNNRLILGLFLI